MEELFFLVLIYFVLFTVLYTIFVDVYYIFVLTTHHNICIEYDNQCCYYSADPTFSLTHSLSCVLWFNQHYHSSGFVHRQQKNTHQRPGNPTPFLWTKQQQQNQFNHESINRSSIIEHLPWHDFESCHLIYIECYIHAYVCRKIGRCCLFWR